MQIGEEPLRAGLARSADWLDRQWRHSHDVAWLAFLGTWRLVFANLLARCGLVTHCAGNLAGRAVLVRLAEQVHRHPFDGEAEGEESGREIEGLNVISGGEAAALVRAT
jgi:hypothetical protein